MKRKTRGLSIKLKVLIPASIIIAIICLSMGISMYLNNKNGLIEMGVKEAYMSAKVVVHSIDGDQLAKVEPGCEDEDYYKDILQELRDLKEACGIMYLYTLYADA